MSGLEIITKTPNLKCIQNGSQIEIVIASLQFQARDGTHLIHDRKYSLQIEIKCGDKTILKFLSFWPLRIDEKMTQKEETMQSETHGVLYTIRGIRELFECPQAPSGFHPLHHHHLHHHDHPHMTASDEYRFSDPDAIEGIRQLLEYINSCQPAQVSKLNLKLHVTLYQADDFNSYPGQPIYTFDGLSVKFKYQKESSILPLKCVDLDMEDKFETPYLTKDTEYRQWSMKSQSCAKTSLKSTYLFSKEMRVPPVVFRLQRSQLPKEIPKEFLIEYQLMSKNPKTNEVATLAEHLVLRSFKWRTLFSHEQHQDDEVMIEIVLSEIHLPFNYSLSNTKPKKESTSDDGNECENKISLGRRKKREYSWHMTLYSTEAVNRDNSVDDDIRLSQAIGRFEKKIDPYELKGKSQGRSQRNNSCAQSFQSSSPTVQSFPSSSPTVQSFPSSSPTVQSFPSSSPTVQSFPSSSSTVQFFPSSSHFQPLLSIPSLPTSPNQSLMDGFESHDVIYDELKLALPSLSSFMPSMLPSTSMSTCLQSSPTMIEKTDKPMSSPMSMETDERPSKERKRVPTKQKFSWKRLAREKRRMVQGQKGFLKKIKKRRNDAQSISDIPHYRNPENSLDVNTASQLENLTIMGTHGQFHNLTTQIEPQIFNSNMSAIQKDKKF